MHLGGHHYQRTQVMLKAVAALRNASLDMYYVSPNCSQGHPEVWKTQLASRGLWPFECAVQGGNLSGLLDALDTLTIPEFVPGCGCRGFTPRLPQDLRSVVCRTLDRVHTTRPSGSSTASASAHASGHPLRHLTIGKTATTRHGLCAPRVNRQHASPPLTRLSTPT